MASVTTERRGVKAGRAGPLPAVRGKARWKGLVPNAHTLLCGCGWLSLETEAGVRSDFWVKTIAGEAGQLLGYRLTKQDADTGAEDGTTYDVDLGAGTCECKDFLTRSHLREDGSCKHLNGLRAALRNVNLL